MPAGILDGEMDMRSRTLILLLVVFSIPTDSQASQVRVEDYFEPSGWIGDIGDLALNLNYSQDPHSPPNCIEIIYSAERSSNSGWAGIYWIYPTHNWGGKPGWVDIFTGASRLTFWARGESGSERATFKMGGIAGEYSDTVRPALTLHPDPVSLSRNWTRYEIDLRGRDLSHIIGGFCWVTGAVENPDGCRIYLDDIQYEWDLVPVRRENI